MNAIRIFVLCILLGRHIKRYDLREDRIWCTRCGYEFYPEERP